MTDPKVYVLITTSLIPNNFDMRKNHYIKAITSVLKRADPTRYKIVIVENNGQRPTFLDGFGVDVLYTTNNFNSPVHNIGYMEMKDILTFIDKYQVQDDDFIIKISGRYFLSDPCPFFDLFESEPTTDAIIRYGASGLIGMRCKYMKTVVPPANNIVSLETLFDNVAKTIPNKKVVEYLGVNYVDKFSYHARYH